MYICTYIYIYTSIYIYIYIYIYNNIVCVPFSPLKRLNRMGIHIRVYIYTHLNFRPVSAIAHAATHCNSMQVTSNIFNTSQPTSPSLLLPPGAEARGKNMWC